MEMRQQVFSSHLKLSLTLKVFAMRRASGRNNWPLWRYSRVFLFNVLLEWTGGGVGGQFGGYGFRYGWRSAMAYLSDANLPLPASG